MKNSKNIRVSILLAGIIIGLLGYFFQIKILSLRSDQKEFITKYIFPYRMIDNISESNSKLKKTIK